MRISDWSSDVCSSDLVFLDLEDAVTPKEKISARAKVIDALKNLDWGDKTRCVRINDLGTEWCYEDIIHVTEQAHEHLDTNMLPKARCASDLNFVVTRSEESREGKECVMTCRSRWLMDI